MPAQTRLASLTQRQSSYTIMTDDSSITQRARTRGKHTSMFDCSLSQHFCTECFLLWYCKVQDSANHSLAEKPLQLSMGFMQQSLINNGIFITILVKHVKEGRPLTTDVLPWQGPADVWQTRRCHHCPQRVCLVAVRRLSTSHLLCVEHLCTPYDRQ